MNVLKDSNTLADAQQRIPTDAKAFMND